MQEHKAKPLISSDVTLDDFYGHYKIHAEKPVDKTIYSKFLTVFFSKLKHEILHNDFDFHMPEYLGMLGMRLIKPKVEVNEEGAVRKLNIDWGGTIKLYRKLFAELKDATESKVKAFIKAQPSEEKKILKHFNEDTHGYYGQLVYFKNYPGATAKFKGKAIRRFKPSRILKKDIRDIIRTKGVENIGWSTM